MARFRWTRFSRLPVLLLLAACSPQASSNDGDDADGDGEDDSGDGEGGRSGASGGGRGGSAPPGPRSGACKGTPYVPPKPSLARLTNVEYANTIRSLFSGLDVQLTALPDEVASHGFLNDTESRSTT